MKQEYPLCSDNTNKSGKVKYTYFLNALFVTLHTSLGLLFIYADKNLLVQS
jgi:hypothetical protein